MSEIDQQFIEFVVKSLVGKPDAVQVKRTIDEKGVLLELTVDPDDLGRVIGKRGATAQSLRTLLRALGTKNDARYNLKIIDNGVGGDKKVDKSESPDENIDDVEAEAPAEEPEAVAEEEATAEEEETREEDKTSERLAETRKELADLDDLDL
ncbi:MAG TPA: KH domain-containing protein [Candidatus Saccharimonadales bacterium]|nr:KH domain-containing protein [Candidatus Saccharimonadales bacterium]